MFFGRNNKTVYLDYSASTPLLRSVFLAMKPYFFDIYANPSSLYKDGVKARKAIKISRNTISKILGTTPDTILFTSGGTESNNLAILGSVRKNISFGNHIITTGIEHSSVLKPIKKLEEDGFNVTYIPVDQDGQINILDIIKSITSKTILITIMHANNEIGTILPISEIGREVIKWRKKNNSRFPIFHTDACQSTNYLDISVEKLHVDLLTLNGSKIYGPKNIGILYKRREVEVEPILYGGGQENGIRPGTEDTASIVGLAQALYISYNKRNLEIKRVSKLRNYFWKRISSEIKEAILNGPPILGNDRLANNLSVSFIGVESEALIIYFDARNIKVSSGSACSLNSDESSHVLKACVLSKERLESCIRFTLGRNTKKSDIDYVMKHLSNIVKKLRSTSN